MKQQGSILLIILLSFSALIIMCSKQWLFTTLMIDTVLAKEAHEKKFWLMQGLLECSSILCKEQWDEIQRKLYKEKNTLHLLIPQWPPDGEYRAEIKIMYVSEGTLQLQTYLFKSQKNICMQKCLLTKEAAAKNLRISDWTS